MPPAKKTPPRPLGQRLNDAHAIVDQIGVLINEAEYYYDMFNDWFNDLDDKKQSVVAGLMCICIALTTALFGRLALLLVIAAHLLMLKMQEAANHDYFGFIAMAGFSLVFSTTGIGLLRATTCSLTHMSGVCWLIIRHGAAETRRECDETVDLLRAEKTKVEEERDHNKEQWDLWYAKHEELKAELEANKEKVLQAQKINDVAQAVKTLSSSGMNMAPDSPDRLQLH